MEKLLHYAWKHRILPLKELFTTDGRSVEIVDTGQSNRDAGPDFFNAKVRIGDTMWAGNVEIHLRSSDWFRHGHHLDSAYDNVILHVTTQADMEVRTQGGKQPPQLVLELPDALLQGYEELLTTMDYPRCHRQVPSFPPLLKSSWMDALLMERLMARSQRILDYVEDMRGDWAHALMVTLARSFGFSLNGEVFERWGRMLPLHAAGKHRDNLFQLNALFLGTAGLLGKVGDEALEKEYAYLTHKFSLTERLQEKDWRYMRTRPQNFPHVRILQLAQLYQRDSIGLSNLLDARDISSLQDCFVMKGLTKKTINLLLINTVVPVLYAYGRYHNEEPYEERAFSLLEQLKAEDNYIMRQWRDCGIKVDTAADSQALIQLKKEYCDRKDCLRCRFGYEFLKRALPPSTKQ